MTLRSSVLEKRKRHKRKRTFLWDLLHKANPELHDIEIYRDLSVDLIMEVIGR